MEFPTFPEKVILGETEIQYAFAVGSLSQVELSQKELKRQHEHQVGKNAFENLVQILKLRETYPQTFPHPHFSISHSQGLAVAVYQKDYAGVGVDLEFRQPNPKAQHLFLNEGEQQWITRQGLQWVARQGLPSLLQKAWTLKEAAYKADLKERQTNLKKYEIDEWVSSTHTTSFTSESFLELEKGSLSQGVFLWWSALLKWNEQDLRISVVVRR